MPNLKLNGRYYRMYPTEKFLEHAEEPLELDTATTSFLIVDVYGLGFSPNDARPHEYPSLSSADSAGKEKDIVVNHIRPAMDAARNAGLPIIYLNNSAPRIAINHSELAKIARRCCDMDWEEWGSEDCPASAGNGEQRSAGKLTEGTHEESTETLHSRREGRHPETASAGQGAGLNTLRRAGAAADGVLPLAEGVL